jgi:HlyD family secretion protein
MKKWIPLTLIAILAILIILSITEHKDTNKYASLVKVTRGNIIEEVQAAGYITPQHSISVKSEISGNVVQIFVNAGEYIKQGQALVAIQPKPAPASYAAAKEDVLEKTQNLRTANQNLARYTLMLKEKLISENYGDYITAQQVQANAKAELALSEEQLSLQETGKTSLGTEKIDNTVVAPVSGYIMKRNVDVGDFVDPISSQQTATILFTISDMKDLMFEGYVDEADSNKIYPNMPATVEVGAIPGLKIEGVLTKISLQSQQAGDASHAVDQSSIVSRSPFAAGFQVQVGQLNIPNTVQLRDGYSATANIAVKSALNVPIIPERILHFDGEQAYVLLPTKDSDKPKKQSVTLGISDGINTQILDGLKIGDVVLDEVSTDNDGD